MKPRARQLPPADVAKHRTRSGELFRGTDYSYKRWSRDDLPALGMRHRRHYDMRATFDGYDRATRTV